MIPIIASGALQFAFERATTEGKITIASLVVVSLFSWTVIFTKAWQLTRARRVAKAFFKAFNASRDPLELRRAAVDYDGAPAFEVYEGGVTELVYHLENNPVLVDGQKRISAVSFTSVKAALERTSAEQALVLEKGMIVLSTAVAGGPFIGLLGTVWGVMETFSGIARANTASLTAMAPGVAGALIATVIGLFVAIPAMFAYNFMVTSIRAITQELDAFSTGFATHVEHLYVDNRPLSAEISEANRSLVEGIQRANESLVEQLATTLRR